MVMNWVKLVLARKGMCEEAIARISNLYSDNLSIVVVNNVLGKVIQNIRLSIRQGDKASMEWFTYGIDPIINYLEKRLQGILIHSTPVQGPLPALLAPPLPQHELRYKLIAYCDDVKPAITTMAEFLLVDRAMLLFESSSGCKMHRDPHADKCKFLALGRWKGTLTQEDLPCNFFSLSDHLDMLGVTLKATYTATRKTNGDELQDKFKKVVGPWRAGKFMPLTMRPYSLNSYAFPKLWHRCSTIDLRVGDVTAINKQAKAWLYADMLEKPEELALYRQPFDGGFGLHHVQLRALAYQISCFLETSCNPKFRRNQYHESLLKYHVFEENIPQPDESTHFKGEFFPALRRLNSTPLNISKISLKEIYRFLLEEVTMRNELGPQTLKPLRAELSCPENQWNRVWPMARKQMLGPNICSFLFKLLHQILPTAQRISRILPNQSQNCSRCQVESQETLQHALFDCPANYGVGNVLLNGLKKFDPNLSTARIMTLDYDFEEEQHFSIVWTTGNFLFALWKLRVEKKRVELISIRSELEANCRLLRESSLNSITEILSQIF